MQTDRLLRLADFLETVPEKSFDMRVFGEDEAPCGFSGCALGWAAHAKLFPELAWENGDFLVNGEDDQGDVVKTATIVFGDGSRAEGDEIYDGCFAEHDHRGDTPKQTAERIRQFVKANSSSPSGASPRA